jgi:lipopolysaccharide/colanic/teichoic acid biosynthesis glycosyltransferase
MIGATFALVLLSPVMLLVALLIKCVSPGPVLFRQARIGYMGKLFSCYKFRTMHVRNTSSAHESYCRQLISSTKPMTKLETMNRDPRLIRFGRIIRKTALDELPQLFNVLRGEMSLVGPRPCIPYEYERYARWHRGRVDALPGMTGLWQVSGKNRRTFTEMIRLDISYAKRWSLWLDLGILLRTVPAILEQVRE